MQQSFGERLLFAWRKLKSDKALLSVGIIESFFKISLNLFLFIWTPLLEETAGGLVHPGAIFACFMFSRLIGSEIFEVIIKLYTKASKILLSTNSYIISIFITITGAMSFYFTYFYMNFQMRLILFIYFDVINNCNFRDYPELVNL